jgi:uncharacterized protein
MRIVADTNVIVSALVFGGVPRQVLEMADAGQCELFYSAAIQDEVQRILAGKFGWDESRLRQVLPPFWSMGEMVVPRATVHAVADDPDDDRILECALAAGAAFIVSGDRHLLRLQRYRSILIVSPREFLEGWVGD